MLIEIDTPDKQLSFELFGNPESLGLGARTPLPFGGILELQDWRFRKAAGAAETLELLLSFGVGVSSSLVANWLWAKFNGKVTTLRINRIDVRLHEGEIQRVIAEQIKFEHK
jgi:hypothetical protein